MPLLEGLQPCTISLVSLTSLVKLFFSYSPLPDSSPTTTDPPPKKSISSRFPSRFRVSCLSRLKIDSKTTRERLENDSKTTPWAGGRWWGGDESGSGL